MSVFSVWGVNGAMNLGQQRELVAEFPGLRVQEPLELHEARGSVSAPV